MVDAGISPYDVLRSGTVNVAKFFNREGEFGTIQEKAVADFVLLNANPLVDIANMKEIEGVMVSGKWLDRKFLDDELSKIASKYAQE